MSIFIKTLSIIALGLAIILLSIFKNPVRNMQQKDYKAQINPFSIVFFDKNGGNSFSISPLDDSFYLTSKKEHFVNDTNFKQNRNFMGEIKLQMERLILGNKKLIWRIVKDKFTVTYEVADNNKGVQIKRILENLPQGVNAIGQTLTLCKGCLLSDQDKKLVYLKEDQLAPEVFELAKNLNLIPLIITEQLPIGTRKILVLGPDGEAKLELEVSPNQDVYFIRGWNILELTTLVSNQKRIILSQTINFY